MGKPDICTNRSDRVSSYSDCFAGNWDMGEMLRPTQKQYDQQHYDRIEATRLKKTVNTSPSSKKVDNVIQKHSNKRFDA